MEITGKIIQVLPEQRFNGKNGEIVKNCFVIEWKDNGYSQKLCLEVIGSDKWEKMQRAAVVGHEVNCRFNVTSREYQGRWYTSCQCFYCATVGVEHQSSESDANPVPQTGIPQDGTHVDDNGLPF